MLNPSAIEHDVYDFLDGNVSYFYSAFGDAIFKSECVKGQYRITTSPSYNSTSPVRTVFRNPKLKNQQLICGEFGAYPQQPIDTFDSPKLINMIGDALNVNCSPLTSLSYDTANSFMDDIPLTVGSGTIAASDKSYNK